MLHKKTIKKEISLSGVGVHSGKHVNLKLKPTSLGKIVFRRTDIKDLELRLDPKKIEAQYCSSLVVEDQKIQTIEHLMATLYAFGIDSLVVELNTDEIPIMDGSAIDLVNAILEAGIDPLPERKKTVKIQKSFHIQGKDSFVSVIPNSDLRITYFIDFDHPAIQKQELSITVNEDNFIKEIAPARTFGFLKDVPALRAQGFALGGSLENAVVLDERRVINEPLRYPDEFVRHKILDFIGDLSLLGYPLLGHFNAHGAGHKLHLKTVHFILDNPEYWTYVE